MSANPRRRYAVVGTGHRAEMFIQAGLSEHREVAQFVAWCDPNPGRMAYYDRLLVEAGQEPVRHYRPVDLERMIAEEKVEAVIVAAPDHTHADLVSRSLRAGARVIVEKPLTTTEEGCKEISDAARETGLDVVMTFNYRYSPRNSTLKEVIARGDIGEVTSIHFEWMLDTVHGADYFRRWHREKAKSGGLLVHKSSHHFDLVNWWLDDTPATVVAAGARHFYGEDAAGAALAGERPARGSRSEPGDLWSLDLNADPRLAELYLDAEQYDGYIRDQDVFAPGVTIEDTMSVLVTYSRGAALTYSLTAYAPWEGYRVSVNGTQGRAELDVVERGAIHLDERGRVVLDPSMTETADADRERPTGERLIVQKHWQTAQEVEIPMGSGSHGGGDNILLADIFRGPREDPLGRPAGYLDGVRAVAVGIAANRSIANDSIVRISELSLGVDLS